MMQVNEFINKVDITDSDNVTCEFEVRKKAMDFYKKYPFMRKMIGRLLSFKTQLINIIN